MTRLRIERTVSLAAILLAIFFFATAAAATDDEPMVVRGRVLLPDGAPAAGAELYWLLAGPPLRAMDKVVEYTKQVASDADGRFEIALSKNDMPPSDLTLYLVAHQAGFGVDWYKVESRESPAEITLQLVEDHPIRGRLTDTEGRPVAGARLAVKGLSASSEGSLDAFLAALERREQNWRHASRKLDHGLNYLLDTIRSATSGRDGRFELSGIGVERVAWVDIAAQGYATDRLRVVNRPGIDAEKYNEIIRATETPFARQEEMHSRLAGPNLDYVAEAELVVRGKLFSGPDQTPVSGALLYSFGRGEGQLLLAKSDDAGRYEIHGLRRNRQSNFLNVPLPDDSDFLPRSAPLAAAPGQAAIELDLELKRGVVVEGRLFDQTTGRGVRGRVSYVPLPANEFANQPGFEQIRGSRNTDEEGRFRVMIIPGPGVLLGHAESTPVGSRQINPYRQATLSEADRQRVMPTDDDARRFATAGVSQSASLAGANSAKVVDHRGGSEAAVCDLPLDPGKTIELSIEDAKGRPVRDTFVSGLADCGPFTSRIAEPICAIFALGADRPRRVCILQPERALAATLTLTGDEAGPMKVRLSAAAIITGRALNSDGQPIPGALVTINYARRSASDIKTLVRLDHPINTDHEGQFDVRNIVPGERFSLDFRKENAYFRANLADEQRQLNAGQKLELGDMKLRQLQ